VDGAAAARPLSQAGPVPSPRRPEVLNGRVFRARDVLSRGVLTEAQLRSSAWRRLYRGVYADAALADSHALRIAGARLLLPPDTAFSGRTAAFLHGAPDLVDAGDRVEVSVPVGVRFGPVAGLRIRQVVLPTTDVLMVGTRPCTTGLRTALDIARHEPVADAVPALDVLLAKAVVGMGELREAVTAGVPGRGAARARAAVALASPLAESQPESRVRVALLLAGLRPVPQYSVRDADGLFVARVDLAFVEQRVAVEYDGAWHAEAGQFARDRRRLNRLQAAGWTVLHVTAADLRDLAAVVAGVRALIAAATPGK
jgi:very-short-patch-repair endonuclease